MSLLFWSGASLQTASAPAPTDTPPSVTAEDSLDGRTLTVTITDSDGNPAPTFDITMTADSVAVTPSGSGAGPWTYTVASSALDVLLEWEVVATNTEGTAVASGSETVPADLTETATLTLEADNTATAEVADGVFTITITQSSDYPIYAQYDEGNGPGAYVRNTADFADGPILLYPGDITGDTEVGAVLTLGTPPLWIYEGTAATSEPADPSLNWQADTLGNGTFANLGDTDTAYTVTSSEQGDTIRVAYSITDGNGTVSDEASLTVSVPAAPSDTVAPSFVSGVPVDGATDVAIDANLVLTFSEDIVAGSGGEFYLYDTSGPTLIETFNVGTGNGDDSGTIAISGTDVTINPGSNLSQGTGYSIRWNAGAVEDAASNGVAANTGDTLYNFITTQASSGGITVVATGGDVVPVGSGTTNIAIPGTPAEGDLVLVWSGKDAPTTSTPAVSGYTAAHTGGDNSIGRRLQYKFMGVNPDSVVAVPQVAAAGDDAKQAVIVALIRGVDQSNPLDVAVPTAATGNGNTLTPPAITTATNNALVCIFGILDDRAAPSSNTPPSGYSNTVTQSTGGLDGTSCFAVAGFKEVATAGTETPGGWGFSTDDQWVGVTIALRPA